jgi:hypothetical protein
MKTTNIDPVSAFVRSLDGEYYMLREAAEALGVSASVLRRAVSNGIEGMEPSHGAMVGKMKVYLYTIEDIERIKGILESRKQIKSFSDVKDQKGKGGRPTLYSEEERKERARLFSRACYWKKRKKEAKYRKKPDLATHAQEMIDEIELELSKLDKR